MMHYREVERLGIRLSEVGLGCNRLGGEGRSIQEWSGLVRRAVELGVNIFDTAQAYAGGRSEQVLGEALRPGDEVFVATKIGRVDAQDGDPFPLVAMRRAVEDSLGRLQRPCIDFFQLHSPNRADLQRSDWAAAMDRLKAEGKIRFAAMALDSIEDAEWLVPQGLVDLVQITYNIFDIAAEQRLFDLAQRHQVALLCRLTLAQGVLSGKFRAGDKVPPGHRGHMSGARRLGRRMEMAEDLRGVAVGYEGGMVRLAHHFSLTSPAISAIIPGARSIDQLEENVAAAGGRLPEEKRREIEALRPAWGMWEGGYWDGSKT
jgi:myo-inositol catabolism protein IolS